MRHKLTLTISLAAFVLLTTSFVPKPEMPARPTNIILMIGDGMGLTQISYGIMEATERMNFERFKVIGLSKTAASDSKVTDSAAGATAFACGKKTYNGAIGVDDNKLPLKTILEYAEEHGLSTGLVATSAITHATPACFISHQPDRNLYENIAADFLKTDIDVFIGGGLAHFTKRADSTDLTKKLKSKGYTVITAVDELVDTKATKIAALLAPNHLPVMPDRGDFLPLASQKAVTVLSKNAKGFFLMIEGSQIDFGGHDNDANYIKNELVDFDKAIGEVLDFAQKQGNTLVIVTADHETGGFGLNGTPQSYKATGFAPSFTTKDHTGTMVPVFAFGPGAEQFAGIYENTAIFDKMKTLFGF